MEIVELRKITGLTQAGFSKRFNIPLRSVENWESGSRRPPQYVLELLEYRIMHEKPGE